jgi:polar amino acid transport system substrate-binding protein
MKKKLIIALVALLVVAMAVMTAGCGGSGSGSEDKAADEPATEESDGAAAEDTTADGAAADESDLAYLTEQGSMKIGITIYAPMNYYDDDGELVGFDTEFAEAVCAKLGITPEFEEINWDTKEMELQSKTIDCIWNGLTVTADRAKEMLFTDSYMKNMQVAVIRAADSDKYKSVEDMKDANIVAELGSAGETAVKDDATLKSAPYTAMPKQTDALLEVKAGTADVAVLDYTAAKSMVGEGTDYSDLMMVAGVELAAEEYAIGFRLGSDVVPEVNKCIAELTEDGTLDEIAAKYDLTASLISNQ